jgi:ferredoxin
MEPEVRNDERGDIPMTDEILADRGLCDGYGNCVFVAPEIFALDDQDRVVLLRTTADPGSCDEIMLAIAECPTRALTLVRHESAATTTTTP